MQCRNFLPFKFISQFLVNRASFCLMCTILSDNYDSFSSFLLRKYYDEFDICFTH